MTEMLDQAAIDALAVGKVADARGSACPGPLLDGRTVRHSFNSDWMFLWLVWLAGMTGFVIELALYLPSPPVWGYVGFLVHVAIAMELVLLVPFTKFAHAVYRPVSLFLGSLQSRSGPGAA